MISPRKTLVALAVGLVCVPMTAFAGVAIKGKVTNLQELLNPVWNEAKDPAKRRYTFREPAATVPPEARVLRGHISKELCIVALGDGAAPLKTPIRIRVEGGRTSAVTIVVPPGQQLQFENHDPFPHNIYEVSGKGGFAEGIMQPDGQRTWTPPGPGKYELRDKLAPSLRSWVVVDPKAVAQVFPNRKGDFQMQLEPGNYELRAFFNGDAVGEVLPVEVKPGPAEQLITVPLKAGPDKKPDPKKDAPKGGGN